MNVEIRKYLVGTALLTLLTGGIGMWIFHAVRPSLFLSDYIWMPVYFFVVGALLMAGVTGGGRTGDMKRLVQAYLLARIVKLFVSVIAVVVFCLAVQTEVTVVVAAFVINYFIYLMYDSWFFSRLGKSRKIETKEI